MEHLTAFLQSQTILQISPKAGDPWIANVLMGSETPDRIYFVGSPDTLYGQQLTEDPTLAFATAWHHEDDRTDRKGIQGVGTARLEADEESIATGVRLHNQNYPEFADRITVEWIKNNDRNSGVWVITPQFIKFWNDEVYGPNGSDTFTFN